MNVGGGRMARNQGVEKFNLWPNDLNASCAK